MNAQLPRGNWCFQLGRVVAHTCLASLVNIARTPREEEGLVLRVEGGVGQVPVVHVLDATG